MAKKLFFLVIVLLNLQIYCMQEKNNDKKDESTLLDALISRFGKKIDKEKHYRGKKNSRASMNIMRSLFNKQKTPKDFTRRKLDLLLIDIITKNITMSSNQKKLVLLTTKVYPFFRDYCREHDALLSDQESGYLELLTTQNALGAPTNRATKKECFEVIRATLFNMAKKQRRKRKEIFETTMALDNKMLKEKKKNFEKTIETAEQSVERIETAKETTKMSHKESNNVRKVISTITLSESDPSLKSDFAGIVDYIKKRSPKNSVGAIEHLSLSQNKTFMQKLKAMSGEPFKTIYDQLEEESPYW